MPTLRNTAALLRNASSTQGKIAIARELGFTDSPLVATSEMARNLGLSEHTSDVVVIRGRGALRALLFSIGTDESLRAVFSTMAKTLSRATGSVSWLVLASTRTHVGICCWSMPGPQVRVAALIADGNQIIASDAETLAALFAARDGDDLVVHTRWYELLGREALSRTFYKTLERRTYALADSIEIRDGELRLELALLYVSRLLFLCFLEAKGWMNADRAFLAKQFDHCMETGGRFHERVLQPLFFGTLNTPIRKRAATAVRFGAIPFLNGGLFARGPLEKSHRNIRFSDEEFGLLFSELLGAYRFTAREDQLEWSEAAVDPEMLGRAFESLMASRERRSSGAFYTPQELVSRVTNRSLAIALASPECTESMITDALGGAALASRAAAQLRQTLRTFVILDPACGSGAFLVHVMERLAALQALAGDTRRISIIRREIVSRAIHGVDINPTAVWLCELRLWLSVVIEHEEAQMGAVPPLPNLDCNIRVGDALSGEDFNEPPALVGRPAVLARMRQRYVKATGPAKAPLRKALAREEMRRALGAVAREVAALDHRRRERLISRKEHNLFGERSTPGTEERKEMRRDRQRAAALRRERDRIQAGGALPFSFPSHFGIAHSLGGFNLVIGNPPWVRLHNIPVAARAALRSKFTVFRYAAWEFGSTNARASKGFASQVDLAALFVERSSNLLSENGCVALLLPAKLWRSLAGGAVRSLLNGRMELCEIDDWTDAVSSFDAAVYPSIMLASPARTIARDCTAAVRRKTVHISWSQPPELLRLVPADSASPWLILPPEVRAAFERLRCRGTPIGASDIGRPTLGVKCGCNDAFTVDLMDRRGSHVLVEQRGRGGEIEREMVRPLLRGESLVPWRVPPSAHSILWTHDDQGQILSALPPGAARWLGPWKRQLSARTDLHGSSKWWSLFRTEAADCTRARVIWNDFGRQPRAAFLPAHDPTVPLNTCYVMHCDVEADALALVTLLNSPVCAAWLNAVAEPARGGWHRYLAWTVALLPVPHEWPRVRNALATIAERAFDGDLPSKDELNAAACKAYRLRRDDIAPLVAWMHTDS